MKNVLFITYAWPPSGKATLHWPLAMLQHLPKHGWQPSVLTTDEDTFSHKDESLVKKIPKNLHIIKTSANEPFHLYRKFIGKKDSSPLLASEAMSTTNTSLRHKLALWIRLNLFIPDARVGWYFSAVPAGKKFLRSHTMDAIVTIGPPHSAHLIGWKLSKKFNIPHVPILIDPWVDIVYYHNLHRSKFSSSIDIFFERKVLQNAKHVIFVTNTTLSDYHKKYSFLQEKSSVLYWGYNEEYFSDRFPTKSLENDDNSKEKIILHAGNMYDYQNPIALWKCVKNEIANGKKLRLRFLGTLSPAVKKSLEEFSLLPFCDFIGFLPYENIVEELYKADYLLVCAAEKRHLPGKLFEYLRVGKPIIAFGDDNVEVAEMLQLSNSGILFSHNFTGNIFDAIKNVQPNIEFAKQFSREKIAEGLSGMLRSIITKT